MVKSFTCCAGGLGSIQGRGTQHFQMTFISEISAYLSIACEIKSEGALYSVFYAEASKRPQTWELRVPCVDSQPYYLTPCTVHIFLLLITNHLIVMFSHTLHHSMFYRWEACPFICHMSTTIPIAHNPKTYISHWPFPGVHTIYNWCSLSQYPSSSAHPNTWPSRNPSAPFPPCPIPMTIHLSSPLPLSTTFLVFPPPAKIIPTIHHTFTPTNSPSPTSNLQVSSF